MKCPLRDRLKFRHRHSDIESRHKDVLTLFLFIRSLQVQWIALQYGGLVL